MQVRDLQKKSTELINRWDELRKHKHSKEQSFMHLSEEVGELAYHMLSKHQRPEKYDPEEVRNSIGDIVIQTMNLASKLNVDVEATVKDIINTDLKIIKNKT